MYINKSGALLERMASSGADIISLDWTVTIPEARARIGDKIGILYSTYISCVLYCYYICNIPYTLSIHLY